MSISRLMQNAASGVSTVEGPPTAPGANFSVSQTSTYNISSLDLELRDVELSGNGQFVYINDYQGGNTTTVFHVLEMSTPFDLSTATDNGSVSFSSPQYCLGIVLNLTGDRMVAAGFYKDYAEYDLSVPNDISTNNLIEQNDLGGLLINAISCSPDGDHIHVSRFGAVQYVSANNLRDLSIAESSEPLDDSDPDADPDHGVSFFNGGYTLVNSGTTNRINLYTVSSPYLASTASFSSSTVLSASISELNGLSSIRYNQNDGSYYGAVLDRTEGQESVYMFNLSQI